MGEATLIEAAPELQQRIVRAMETLGREPDLWRIARKANLPTEDVGRGRVKLAAESIAAFDGLLKAGRIRHGSRGGLRLVGR